MSSTVKWTAIYDVKIDSFNEHHKHLFDIINQLFIAMDNGKDKMAMEVIFSELLNYTEFHFNQEEDFMRQHAYPEKDFNEHIEQHRTFIKKITELHHNFKYKHFSVSVDLLLFLQSWLITHIMVTDKKYTAFFNVNGVI